MFIEERHQKILEFLNEKGRIEVQELSKLFQVSQDSARRDLRIMEEKGLVKRTYGGAILPDKVAHLPVYKERKELNPEIKTTLAKLAVAFIQPNDTILLDGSTTVAMMVPLLNKISGLTVITNSITIANDVINYNIDCKLFLTGGMVDRDSANTISIESLNSIQRLTVDKAFICPCGLSAEWGLTTSSIDEASIKKAMLEAGREVFILADSSKFEQRFLAYVAPIKPEYTIITDMDKVGFNVKFHALIQKGLQIVRN